MNKLSSSKKETGRASHDNKKGIMKEVLLDNFCMP